MERRADAGLLGPDDSGGRAVLVEQHRERDGLVLDERLGVPASTRTDGSDRSSGGEDLLVPIADLTGPLATRQSAEVAKEE